MKKEIKLLAIGNSFSVDALQYFYQIASSLGIERIEIGNLYIGSCSLERHLRNITNEVPEYTYYTNYDGTWVEHPEHTVNAAILIFPASSSSFSSRGVLLSVSSEA